MVYVIVRILKKNKVVVGTHQYTEDQLESLSKFIAATDIHNVELCIALEVIS